MKICVTGGTGFVGRAVARTLRDRGHEVCVLVRNAETARTVLPEGTALAHGSLDDPESLAAMLREHRPAALAHLAWEGLPDYSEANSRKNLGYGVRLYELAAAYGVAHIVTTGSCWEYAGRLGMLTEDSPLGDAKAFPAAKNDLRRSGMALARQRGFGFTWLRLFYVYGPGQHGHSLLPTLIGAAQAGQEPALRTPFSKNDFIHVDDVALAFALALEQDRGGGTYNVGSGESTQVLDVARFVYAALGQEKILQAWEAGLGQSPASEDFWADLSRLRADTGFCPRIALRDGVLDMARRAVQRQEGESR